MGGIRRYSARVSPADLGRGKAHEGSALGLGALILTGVYPCPGAILILSLSLGILAVLAIPFAPAVYVAPPFINGVSGISL